MMDSSAIRPPPGAMLQAAAVLATGRSPDGHVLGCGRRDDGSSHEGDRNTHSLPSRTAADQVLGPRMQTRPFQKMHEEYH